MKRGSRRNSRRNSRKSNSLSGTGDQWNRYNSVVVYPLATFLTGSNTITFQFPSVFPDLITSVAGRTPRLVKPLRGLIIFDPVISTILGQVVGPPICVQMTYTDPATGANIPVSTVKWLSATNMTRLSFKLPTRNDALGFSSVTSGTNVFRLLYVNSSTSSFTGAFTTDVDAMLLRDTVF